jgi:hypothetical protein
LSCLDFEPAVLRLARDLGLSGTQPPVEAIIGLCRERIDRWAADSGGVHGMGQLEALVTSRLQMVFEEIWSDKDFDRLKDEYAVGNREFIFATLRMRFEDEDTYGMLVKRLNAAPAAPDLYIAVIDCRGNKAARRFFTRWHEIAHRMTTDADPDLPRFRSAKDPIERLMDEIAGRVGFYEPLFIPAFGAAMRGRTRLDFDVVDEVVRRAFPASSFQAALCACTHVLESPALYVEATLALKISVKRRLNNPTPSMFGEDEPPSQLRAITVVRNRAAKADGFEIPTNMRVPASCVISTCFNENTREGLSARESLRSWEDSKGKRLADCEVWIEARWHYDRVLAVAQPMVWPQVRKGVGNEWHWLKV